jgi:hypothetical protein
MNHQSQADLLTALVAIFPDFKAEWAADGDAEFHRGSLHSVYVSFLPFVSKANPSQRQLQRLATVLDGAVAAGGEAENAVATCFFEGFGPGPLLRALRPLLTPESRDRYRL